MSTKQTSRPPPDSWDIAARRLLKSQMQLHGHSYKSLAHALEVTGYPITDTALALRVNRGTFGLGFALRLLRAMGAKEVKIDHLPLQ